MGVSRSALWRWRLEDEARAERVLRRSRGGGLGLAESRFYCEQRESIDWQRTSMGALSPSSCLALAEALRGRGARLGLAVVSEPVAEAVVLGVALWLRLARGAFLRLRV